MILDIMQYCMNEWQGTFKKRKCSEPGCEEKPLVIEYTHAYNDKEVRTFCKPHRDLVIKNYWVHVAKWCTEEDWEIWKV